MLDLITKIITNLFKSEALAKWILDYVDKRNKQQAKVKFLNTVAVYDSLNKIINTTNIQRILIFRMVHDNSIGSLDKVTCIIEVYTAPFHSEKDDYIDYSIDEVYARMLKDIYEKDIELNVPKMKSGTLKDIYEANGVKYSLVSRVCDSKIVVNGENKNILIYMSIASSYSKEEFGEYGPIDSAKTRVVLNNELNKIKNYYRKYYTE